MRKKCLFQFANLLTTLGGNLFPFAAAVAQILQRVTLLGILLSQLFEFSLVPLALLKAVGEQQHLCFELGNLAVFLAQLDLLLSQLRDSVTQLGLSLLKSLFKLSPFVIRQCALSAGMLKLLSILQSFLCGLL